MTDLLKLVHQHGELEGEWLKAKEVAAQLRERKNDMLAEYTDEAEGKSHAEKERNARTSQKWKDYVSAMLAAEHEERLAKGRVGHVQMKFDALRSMGAAQRANMNAGSLTP